MQLKKGTQLLSFFFFYSGTDTFIGSAEGCALQDSTADWAHFASTTLLLEHFARVAHCPMVHASGFRAG